MEGFPLISRLLHEPLSFGVLVLSETGVLALMAKAGGSVNCEVPPAWPVKSVPINFCDIFNKKSTGKAVSKHKMASAKTLVSVIDVDGSDDGEEAVAVPENFVRDLATMGFNQQIRYDEARAFRVLCFNDSEIWAKVSTASCALDSQITTRSVRGLLPMSFLDLPAFVGFSLSALLHGSFDIVKFSVKFSAVAKKRRPISFGSSAGT